MKIEVIYEGDLHTIATHTASGQTLHTDAPKDNGGQGQTFSPTDLVAASLASCIATLMGTYAENNDIDLRGMKLEIEKTMSQDTPRRIVKLATLITLPKGITEEQKVKLKKVAHSCPVQDSLHPDIEAPITLI